MNNKQICKIQEEIVNKKSPNEIFAGYSGVPVYLVRHFDPWNTDMYTKAVVLYEHDAESLLQAIKGEAPDSISHVVQTTLGSLLAKEEIIDDSGSVIDKSKSFKCFQEHILKLYEVIAAESMFTKSMQGKAANTGRYQP